MAINKIAQTVDALPNAESGEWAWIKIVSNELKFNSDGSNTRTIVTTAQTQTLTNKTLTAPTITAPTITGATSLGTGSTITAPILSGSVTGTYTLAGTPTITAPTITAPVVLNSNELKVLAAQADYSNTVTAATITGFSWTVVAGATYVFDVNLPTTMTTVGGLTISFKLTTATLTSIQYESIATTAVDNTTGVSTTGTTTTDATKIFDSKTAAYTSVRIRGSMVVNAGGTFAFQGTQNTAASGGDASAIKLGAFARVARAL